MKAWSGGTKQPQPRPFPTGFFVGIVASVCLALVISAGYTFSSLLRLRTEYLHNRGSEIAMAIDVQARGQGRRNNPAFWQTLIQEDFPAYSGSASSIALVDGAGAVLAIAGNPAPVATGFATVEGVEVFVLDQPLSSPRQMHAGQMAQLAGWHLRVAVYSAAADSIKRRAYLNLVAMGLAIATLLVLSYFSLRMLNRFLELQAREGSERHLKALGAMAAALAHEIRNPLGAMKGLTQLAQEELPAHHGAQASMKTVVNEAERLERLVTDLLNFARPKKPELGAVDLADLIGDVKGMLQPRLDAAGVSLEVELGGGSQTLHSDEGGLRQVLLNVLLNAVDATPPAGNISVRVTQAEKGRDLVVEVDDSGPGLADLDPEELFQPFVTTKTKGTGLGLAVSRRVIESLGGSLTLANLPQGGTRCSIRVPVDSRSESRRIANRWSH